MTPTSCVRHDGNSAGSIVAHIASGKCRHYRSGQRSAELHANAATVSPAVSFLLA